MVRFGGLNGVKSVGTLPLLDESSFSFIALKRWRNFPLSMYPTEPRSISRGSENPRTCSGSACQRGNPKWLNITFE